MNSEQNNTNAYIEKQQRFSSTPSLNIYHDEIIEETKQTNPSNRPNKPVNGNVFANAINKLETNQLEQQQQQDQQQMKKKKQHYNKKKSRNKKFDSNYNEGDDTHRYNNRNTNKSHPIDHHQDHHRPHRHYHHHHKQRSNQGEYSSWEGDRTDSSQFQFPVFVPANRDTNPIHYLQHLKYPNAEDGNAKVLADHQSRMVDLAQACRENAVNSNYEANSVDEHKIPVAHLNRSSNPSPRSWMDEISDNSKIRRIMVYNGGKAKSVAIPDDVTACLVKELLLQKENAEISTRYHYSVYGNQPSSGHLNVPSHVFHDHPDRGVHYGNYAPAMNPPQFFNGFGTFPPPCDNYGAPMPPSMANPMLQPAMHPLQYVGPPPIVANPQSMPWAFSGCFHSNEFPIEEQTGSVPYEYENSIEEEGVGRHNRPSKKTSDTEKTPVRANIHQDAAVECVDHPQVQDQNHNAVTPHRDIVVGNEENPSRRVSFSPMIPLATTPATACGGDM